MFRHFKKMGGVSRPSWRIMIMDDQNTEYCGVLPICRDFWPPNALLFNLAFLKDSN
jgi:hypothetical protein